MAHIQTTNHPLGEVLFLEDDTNDMLTGLRRHDRDGTTQSWGQEVPTHSFHKF